MAESRGFSTDTHDAPSPSQIDAADRYTPSWTHPGEWVCGDCSSPTGQRITLREGHDTWHDLTAEQAAR